MIGSQVRDAGPVGQSTVLRRPPRPLRSSTPIVELEAFRARRDGGVGVPSSAGVRPARSSGIPRGGGRDRAPLVLTRRGLVVLRLLIAAAVAALVVAVLVAFSGGAQAGDERGVVPTRVRMVMPGDTLWRIAREEAPGVDPAEVVAVLRDINDLDGGSLRVGQELLVPTRLRG